MHVLYFISICFPESSYRGDACIDFRYSMYGHHIGQLQLFTRTSPESREDLAWMEEGQQGEGWQYQEVTIENVRGKQVCQETCYIVHIL